MQHTATLPLTGVPAKQHNPPHQNKHAQHRYWKRRLQRLSSIIEQIKTKSCKDVIYFLNALVKAGAPPTGQAAIGGGGYGGPADGTSSASGGDGGIIMDEEDSDESRIKVALSQQERNHFAGLLRRWNQVRSLVCSFVRSFVVGNLVVLFCGLIGCSSTSSWLRSFLEWFVGQFVVVPALSANSYAMPCVLCCVVHRHGMYRGWLTLVHVVGCPLACQSPSFCLSAGKPLGCEVGSSRVGGAPAASQTPHQTKEEKEETAPCHWPRWIPQVVLAR